MNQSLIAVVLGILLLVAAKRSKPKPSPRLKELQGTDSVNLPRLQGWNASNASFFEHKQTRYLLVRYVNYFLNADLTRQQEGPGKSLNVLVELAPSSWTTSVRHWILNVDTHLQEPPHRISYGIEDARVLSLPSGKCILVGASVGYGRDEKKSDAVVATLDMDAKSIRHLTILPSPNQAKQQKNWIPFMAHDGTVRLLHWWQPVKTFSLDLRTYQLSDPSESKNDVYQGESPLWGSANLIPLSEEEAVVAGVPQAAFLTCVHTSRLVRRLKVYEHSFVALDSSMNVIKMTKFFSFSGALIEFCMALALVNGYLYAYYTVLDRNLACTRIELSTVFS